MKQFKVHFDGGARPTNPGNGYGSFEFETQFGEIWYRHANHRIEFGHMSNNEAEYMALIHALESLRGDVNFKKLPEDIYLGGITLAIYSDSKLVVEQLSGRWKVKKEHLKKLIEKCRELLKGFGHWKITWRPRKFNVQRFGH